VVCHDSTGALFSLAKKTIACMNARNIVCDMI